MTPDPAPHVAPPSEILLQHLEWIKRLARHMVGDVQIADDLAQEVCVVALERRPDEQQRLRPWLASIMRNALRERRRGEARRSTREQHVARAEALEPTAQLVERVELEHELVALVLALDEPFRSAILLRFFEDRPPRAIARLLGVSVNTVNSRIARGLERLRERLDRKHGDRTKWVLALAPLISRPEPVALAVIGGIIMNTKWLLTLSSLLAVATVAAVFALRSGPASTVAPRSGAASVLAEVETAQLANEAPQTSERARAQDVAPAPAAPAHANATTAVAELRVVRGRILDPDGGPLPAIRVRSSAQPDVVSTSAAGGWFELHTSLAQGEIESGDERWTTVRAGSFRAGGGPTPLVIVAPWIELGGRVVDERRAGVAHAHISVVLPDNFAAHFDETLEATHTLGWDASSNADGAFVLGRVPSIAGARLRVLADGYERLLVDLPVASARELELELARPKVPLSGALRGRVVDPRGAPVEGARVAAGLASSLSNERGEFALELARAVTAETISALKPGFLPARLERPHPASATSSGWPDSIELVLGGPPLSIRGQVVDASGHPCAQLRVWIDDPTPFGNVGRVPFSHEGLLSGQAIPPQILGTEPRANASDGDNFFDWSMSDSPSTSFWPWVVTNDEGWFEIGGLLDRRYKLVVFDKRTLVRHTSDPIDAGEHAAKIELPAPALWPLVAGTVRSDAGLPMEGVLVRLETRAVDLRARVFGGRAQFIMIEPRESATTDAQGRFEFHAVPRSGAQLSLASDRIVPRDFAFDSAMQATDVDVRVFTRCNVQVELRPPMTRAGAIAFADAHGDPLDVIVISADRVNAYTDAELVEGRSEVVSVSSAARFLLLMKNDEIVERMPIQLAAEGVNRLMP